MEPPTLTNGDHEERAENALGDFVNWPDELIVYLFSFVPKCTSMEEVFKTLAQLALVNSTFKQIAKDKVLLNQFPIVIWYEDRHRQ